MDFVSFCTFDFVRFAAKTAELCHLPSEPLRLAPTHSSYVTECSDIVHLSLSLTLPLFLCRFYVDFSYSTDFSHSLKVTAVSRSIHACLRSGCLSRSRAQSTHTDALGSHRPAHSRFCLSLRALTRACSHSLAVSPSPHHPPHQQRATLFNMKKKSSITRRARAHVHLHHAVAGALHGAPIFRSTASRKIFEQPRSASRPRGRD